MSEKTRFQAPRGTHDILPAEAPAWQWLEGKFRGLCRLYRYGEIRTPLFEQSEVIHRTSGETSDIVSKETYDLLDRGGDKLTLRPEGTAPVLRAAIEGGLLADSPLVRLSYIAPMFRYDRPQKGRFRQHHQIGVEALGSDDPAIDAEVIALSFNILNDLGVAGASLKLNSVGSPDDRPVYRQALVDYFAPQAEALSEDSRKRLDTNPLRILDSKDPRDRRLVEGAPLLSQFLTPENKEHFAAVQGHLDRLGVPYTLDPYLVRGLDYYTRTAFEWVHGGLGAQTSVGGGGRYNGLVEALGGPPTPGIGFGMGIERLLLAIADSGVQPPAEPTADVYVVAASNESRDDALLLCQEARDAGLSADFDALRRSLKAQMKSAGKCGARLVLIRGEDEMAAGAVTVRDMISREQQSVPRGDVVRVAREILSF
ncbi:MAG TPA: histidine--tRNA ligase [Armatimonadota bacterium]|jgi:histidyl-tRNA synthetase